MIYLLLLFIVFLPWIVRAFEKRKKEIEDINNQLKVMGDKLDNLIELLEKDKQ